jgi:serine/threonine protein kinase
MSSKLNPYAIHKIHDYYVGKQFASSSFSSVRFAVKQSSNFPLAFKILSKQRMGKLPEGKSMMFAETILYPSLSHQNIAPVLDVIESSGQYFLAMEQFASKDLRTYIEKVKALDEICSAVEYLHSHFIAHSDIKLQNVVFSEEGEAKLIDFGFSRFSLNYVSGMRGSHGYCAPEILSGEKYDAIKADMWSIGVLVYVLFSGEFPFEQKPKNYDIDSLKLSLFPTKVKNILEKLLVVDPSLRISISDLRQEKLFDCLLSRNINQKPDLENPILADNFLISSYVCHCLKLEQSALQSKLNSSEISFEKVLYSLYNQKYRDINQRISLFTSSLPSFPSRGKTLKTITINSNVQKLFQSFSRFFLKNGYCFSFYPLQTITAILNSVDDDLKATFDLSFHSKSSVTISVQINERNQYIISKFFDYLSMLH